MSNFRAKDPFNGPLAPLNELYVGLLNSAGSVRYLVLKTPGVK